MRYVGQIKKLDKLIVADPSYDSSVWCRYQNDNINGENWNVVIDIRDYHEEYEKFDVDGIEFDVVMQKDMESCYFNYERKLYPAKEYDAKKFTIGMDTACVSIGLNENADKILAEKDEWQPASSLKTLTDGEFGSLYEGTSTKTGKVGFIWFTGFLDEDTRYTKDQIIDYLKEKLQIDNLVLTMTDEQVEAIANLMSQKENQIVDEGMGGISQ